jgi:predicted dehydrogenase
VPAELDYQMWLGPAPWQPYTTQRCHYSFRFILDYSGGQVTNWGAHHLDIVQWALGMDNSGPVIIRGQGDFPEDGLFNTAENVDIEYIYADGTPVRCRTGSGSGSILFTGSEGRIFVSREKFYTSPGSIARKAIKPGQVHLYKSRDHRRDFLECVRSRKTPIASAETGHRSATVCHLGNLAMRLGQVLQWDPEKEKFVKNDQANRMLSRPMRQPWRI